MKSVILVSGWGGPGFEWKFSPIFTKLNERGYDITIFKPCNYGWGDINHNGRKLARLVESKEEYDEVHVIGHSMGGLLARVADVEQTVNDQRLISSITTLGTPHRGTLLANFAFFSTSAKQMAIGSDFLTELNSVPSAHSASYYCVGASRDELVFPRSSAYWEGALSDDQFHTSHVGLILNQRVADNIALFLDEELSILYNSPKGGPALGQRL